jgi:polyphenol oxidase
VTPQLLTSRLLPAPHAFTTRHSGHSGGIFSTLNFGNPSDLPREERDTPDTIRANFKLITAALNCQRRELIEVQQVHGADTLTVRPNHPAHATAHDTKADALITDDATRLLIIRVADCAPVLLSSSDGRIVAAAHAGWRGIIAGIIPNTVRAMQDLGATNIAAAIGPCISVDHFEVGPEVAAEFDRVFGKGTPIIRPRHDKTSERPTADLKLAIKLQLQDAGITAIDALPHCTYASPDLFYSHRRDHGKTGRMIGIIGPRDFDAVAPNNPST